YVPRVATGPSGAAAAALVEFDPDLREVQAAPLADYSTTPDASSHGITGAAELKGGAVAFVTDRGRLYLVDPRRGGAAVTDLGRFHPAGEAYVPALFSPDGEAVVCGPAQRPGGGYEWVAVELGTGRRTAGKLPLPVPGGRGFDVLAYGSMTRD